MESRGILLYKQSATSRCQSAPSHDAIYTRLRQRLTQLEEQRQQLIDVTALQTEIRLIVGRLEDFAAKIDAGLEDSDWLSKREMIRALVKRVEVTPDRVNVVFRVDAYPGEASPEKKSGSSPSLRPASESDSKRLRAGY